MTIYTPDIRKEALRRDSQEWRYFISRSNDPVKNYPQWVRDNFTKQEQRYGFMKDRAFYRPLYSLVINGRCLELAITYALARSFLDHAVNNTDAATDIVVGGFLFSTYNDNGLNNGCFIFASDSDAGTPATGTNANGGRHD